MNENLTGNATSLVMELFQLVSDPYKMQKFLNNRSVQKRIISKLSNLKVDELVEVVESLFEKFQHIDQHSQDTEWARHYKDDEGIQREIRKHILQLFSILLDHIPNECFNNIVPDLLAFGDNPDFVKEIFVISGKLKNEQALEFCKAHILSLIDIWRSFEFDRHKQTEFHNKLTELTEITPYFDEIFDFSLTLMPTAFENCEQNQRGTFVSHFRGYYGNLVRRNPSIAGRLVPLLDQTNGDAQQAIFQAIIRIGSIADSETNLYSHLIDLLISNNTAKSTKELVLQIIKKINQDDVKADKGKCLTIILKKAHTLRAEDTASLNELFAALFQILGEPSQQWREAVDIISSKMAVGFTPLMNRTIHTDDPENIDLKIERAKALFVKYNATDDDRMEAIRNLGDVLEYLKKDDIRLANKDESELFNILNNFSIRHHNRSQQADYDKSIYYPWMFYVFLASIYALLELKDKP